MKRAIFIGLVLALAGVLHAQSGKPAAQAPIFEVDPFWPKPLPNHWVTGSTIGLSVDAQDRVWTIHRPGTVEANFKAADLTVAEAVDDEVQPGAKSSAPAKDPIGACCKVAPPVLVYDQAGTLVKSWGGPGAGFEWPDSNHGITVDRNGNVWIAGNGQKDTQVLKFSDAGKFLLQIGKHGVHNGSNDIANFWQPTKIFHEPGGQRGLHLRRLRQSPRHRLRREHRRLQAPLGRLRCQAGRREAAAVQPVGAAFEAVQHRALRDRVERRHGLRLRSRQRSHPGVPQGRDVRQGSLHRPQDVSLRIGVGHDPLARSAADATSTPPTVWTRRSTCCCAARSRCSRSFGDGGRQPGQFFGVHNMDTDSKGNLYTAETYTGARVQRFIFKGVGPVTKVEQGVPWPRK